MPKSVSVLESRDDKAFFQRNKARRYRWRLATQCEVAAYAETGMEIPRNEFLYVAVAKVSNTERVRVYRPASPDAARRLSNEEIARAVFDDMAPGEDGPAKLLDAIGTGQFKMTRTIKNP